MDNEEIEEFFKMFYEGEIDANELMSELEFSGFDGDIIDFLL